MKINLRKLFSSVFRRMLGQTKKKLIDFIDPEFENSSDDDDSTYFLLIF